MRAINASTMRLANRTLLLNHIRMRPISRAELAEETGLTRASVTQIVEELIEDGLVIETSIVERSRLGRRSTQLAIRSQAGYLFGMTLSAMGCTVGAADMHGQVLNSSIEVVNGRSPEEVLNAVTELIRGQMKKMNIEAGQVYGLGVSVPGPVDQISGVIQYQQGLDAWNGVSLRSELEMRTGLKVYIESAANAQALEQKYFGIGNEDFALVRLEDTLSVGVVARDMLYRGAPDFAVELGQCPADHEGRRTLNEMIAGDGEDWRQLLNHPEAPEFGRMLAQLSYPLASVMCIYQVKHAVLGGDLGVKMHSLLPQLTAQVKRLLPVPFNGFAQVSVAESDPVRMAVAAAYHRLFSIE